MEELLDWEDRDPITAFENEEFDDEKKWQRLYEQSEDRTRSRIEAIAKGLRLKKYDREMAYLYGYKVIEDILKEEYAEIWEKSRYSKGRMEYFLSEVKRAFERTGGSGDVLDHIEAVEQEIGRLEYFPRREMVDTLLQESGFYSKKEESKESTKDLYLQLYARRQFDIDPELALEAYKGKEKAIETIRDTSSEDYEQMVSWFESNEERDREKAVNFTDELVDAWEKRASLIPNARNPTAHRPNHEISPVLTDATLHLAKYLVEESVSD